MKDIKFLSAVGVALFVTVATASAATHSSFVDYGTGYYGAGSQTGGPSGGLPNRN